ncbi:MAG: anhydro-N-acetylmuramic acid kinase [Phycisphaeraceae bacterium]|nr:anhydro-N-acetylmuramic acid kinase [Phycisphaeraceae bacterium]
MGPRANTRLVAGCMTGTSIDALDCALVRIEGKGMQMRPELVATLSRDLGQLRPALRALAQQQPMTAGAIAALARDFALLHAHALEELTAEHGLDLVCVHGQTVFHTPPVSWQLLNPWPIVRSLGVPVVFDLRGADLAAGGQGAPITPIADYLLFSQSESLRPFCCVVNLGGFANVTALVTNPVQHNEPTVHGFDICACNQLLNSIARLKLNAEYDSNGASAVRGAVQADAAKQLAGILLESRQKRRSLGTGDEAFDWIHAHADGMTGDDLAATACEAIARRIVSECKEFGPMIVAGGGVKNEGLLAALRRSANAAGIPRIHRSDEFGVPIDFREAMEFAILGALCQDGLPITIPRITKVESPAPLSGSWAFPSRVDKVNT